MRIIISRTDSIGDVILTLPMAGILKEKYPNAEIIFLGQDYVRPVVDASIHIDSFLSWDSLKTLSRAQQVEQIRSLQADVIIHVFPRREIASMAKLAAIPLRIGTARRVYHLLRCNRLSFYSRTRSNLHESQLNIKLLAPLGIKRLYGRDEIYKYYGLERIGKLPEEISSLLSKDQFNLILHPKPRGSAREWGLDNFEQLVKILPEDRYKIFITGTANEGEEMAEFLAKMKGEITDLTGKLTLAELISFINAADGLIAASTGPLHIASALGKVAVGLYAPMRPIHPGRWAPIGARSSFVALDKKCNKCADGQICECIRSIKASDVLDRLTGLSLK
ncbi:MAG: glycosyltransferase family 9 protein [Nitrospinota bacterium]